MLGECLLPILSECLARAGGLLRGVLDSAMKQDGSLLVRQIHACDIDLRCVMKCAAIVDERISERRGYYPDGVDENDLLKTYGYLQFYGFARPGDVPEELQGDALAAHEMSQKLCKGLVGKPWEDKD